MYVDIYFSKYRGKIRKQEKYLIEKYIVLKFEIQNKYSFTYLYQYI